jgi:hypothetical protein
MFFEYEHHFIEDEDDGKPNLVASMLVLRLE